MIIDSSAVLAILLGERDGHLFAATVEDAVNARMFAVAALEVTLVIGARKREAGLVVCDRFMKHSSIETVLFDAEQLRLARYSWWQYGKGRHPAGLNLGDFCSYALAMTSGEALLYRGNDFGLTDVRSAEAGKKQ